MSADITVPSWFDDRDINHAEVVQATDLPVATIGNWARLLRASGAQFGVQFRGDWHYSTRELCIFSIAAALKQLNHPVSLPVLQDVLTYVRANDVPGRPFTIGHDGLPAVVLVDAQVIYGAVIEMMTGVRALEAGGTRTVQNGEAVTIA